MNHAFIHYFLDSFPKEDHTSLHEICHISMDWGDVENLALTGKCNYVTSINECAVATVMSSTEYLLLFNLGKREVVMHCHWLREYFFTCHIFTERRFLAELIFPSN